MEAPKEIWLLPDIEMPDSLSILWHKAPYCTGAIEYIRKDVFIEKVKEFLWAHTPGTDYHVNYIVKKFEKYMEE